MPPSAEPAPSLAAASLLRAVIADDADRGILIMGEHGALDNPNTAQFVLAVASLAGRALLSANGYNVEITVHLLDTWAAEYAETKAP